MIGILIAEKNYVLRLGIRSVLAAHEEFVIAAEISDRVELLPSLLNLEFDIALIELTFFRSIKINELADLRKIRPNLRLLVHSYGSDLNDGVAAIKDGALGYLTKTCSPGDLVNAITTVYKGKPFISELLGEALAEDLFQPSNISHISLSEREFQVFRMLAIGIGLSGIAVHLGLSIKTVSTYKSRILEKIGLPGISELVQYAISNRLLKHHLDEDQDRNSSWEEGE